MWYNRSAGDWVNRRDVCDSLLISNDLNDCINASAILRFCAFLRIYEMHFIFIFTWANCLLYCVYEYMINTSYLYSIVYQLYVYF